MKRKPKRKPAVIAVPLKDLTHIEQAYNYLAKAYRKLKKRMKHGTG